MRPTRPLRCERYWDACGMAASSSCASRVPAMRRLLRDVAEGRDLGDTTTLADASVVNELQRRAAEVPPED